MGWSYDFWKGNFYPEKLESKKLLTYYAQQFDTVEADSTFYRIPSKQTIIDWKEQTPTNFLFSLKFPKIITHVKMLRNCQNETKIFIERAELLKEKLGTLLLQFPPTFKIEHLPLLCEFLKQLPPKHHYVVEVRNKSLLNPSFFKLLKDNNTTCAWTDSTKMPLMDEITANIIYARWEGDRKEVTGTKGKIEVNKSSITKMWAHKLRKLLDENMEVYGYFSKYLLGAPPIRRA